MGILSGENAWQVACLEVLQADLQMELSSAGNDVLAGLLDLTLDHGIGLGQTLQAWYHKHSQSATTIPLPCTQAPRHMTDPTEH